MHISPSRKLIVTHHAPDLDAITSTWIFKRFLAQDFADAKVAFVNPGETISLEEAERHGCQLHEVIHVDTGYGQFDHHQKERADRNTSATSLVYDYVCEVHPDLKDNGALQEIVNHVTEIDHFGEVFWPEAEHTRYAFMIHELIRGHEYTDPHNDESQLYFGFQCLDNAYAALTQLVKAREVIKRKGQEFTLKEGKGLGLLTRNDDTVKLAQKQGYVLVVRKDPNGGDIRIKARPDSSIDLTALYEKIIAKDKKGKWFLHASGKMLLNGSRKSRNQVPSPLSLAEVIQLILTTY